jgi:hypothetical protein
MISVISDDGRLRWLWRVAAVWRDGQPKMLARGPAYIGTRPANSRQYAGWTAFPPFATARRERRQHWRSAALGLHTSFLTIIRSQREADMRKMVGLLLVMLLLPAVGRMWAGDHDRTWQTHAQIRTVESGADAIVLADGTKMWIAEGLPRAWLREGVKITLVYEERDGKQIVTSIEAAE